MVEIIEPKVVVTDTSGYGFKEPVDPNSNGCKCCEKCRTGTGANPCENCNCNNHRKDDSFGCDDNRCKCASSIAYINANPDEFA